MNYYYLKNKDMSYLSKYGEFASSYIETKKSKFYTYVFNIDSEDIANGYIDNIRKDNKNAKHVVYVYSILNGSNPVIRFSDNGEPLSTGTKGILDLIQKECITNICIVIVRYFGGILLGAGPLARTYLNCLRKVIDITSKETIIAYRELTIDFEYNKLDDINSLIKKFFNGNNNILVESIDYKEKIIMKLKIDKNEYDKIYKDIYNLIK